MLHWDYSAHDYRDEGRVFFILRLAFVRGDVCRFLGRMSGSLFPLLEVWDVFLERCCRRRLLILIGRPYTAIWTPPTVYNKRPPSYFWVTILLVLAKSF